MEKEVERHRKRKLVAFPTSRKVALDINRISGGKACLYILLIGFEHIGLDSLAQAVLSNGGDDFRGVLLLGGDPPDYLIHVREVAAHGAVQLSRLHHRFADRCSIFLHCAHHRWVIEDATRNCTVKTASR